jgi:hypothetical protein
MATHGRNLSLSEVISNCLTLTFDLPIPTSFRELNSDTQLYSRTLQPISPSLCRGHEYSRQNIYTATEGAPRLPVSRLLELEPANFVIHARALLTLCPNGRSTTPATLLPFSTFKTCRTGNRPIVIDGKNLSIPAVIAASRYGVHIKLDSSLAIKTRVKKSVNVVKEKLASGKSLYGISTGFGGSGKWLASFLSFDLMG